MILYRRIKDAKIYIVFCLQLSIYIFIYLQVNKNNQKVFKNNHICFAKPIHSSY